MAGETQVVAALEKNKYYTHADLFYVNRHSFWSAGQDSWTLPPTQDQDMFTQLLNVEPVTQGVLQRRRGYEGFSPFVAGALGYSPFTHSYSFRSDGLGLRRVVWCAPNSGPLATDEQGNIVANPVYTPANPSQSASARMVLSRDYGYFSDQTQANLLKWDGTTNSNAVTNWGVQAGTGVSGNVFGPNNTGMAADTPQGSGNPWVNVTNIQGPPDGNFAVLSIPSVGQGDNLTLTNFGFSVPSSAGPIVGIQVVVQGFATGTESNGDLLGFAAGITKNGASGFVGTAISGQFPAANGPIVLGGPANLWGSSFQNTDINNANFGVVLVAFASGDNPAVYNIDSVQVTVYTAGTGLQFTTSTASTNIVLLNGRTYTYAFQNGLTLSTSDLGPFSTSTGPLTGNQVNITGIPVSADPQVSQVLILATADGNDETTLYLAGVVPNGVTTFTDQMPDAITASFPFGATLLTQPLYQYTDAFGNLHGLANNALPPTGLNYMVKHKGRIYGAVGRALHFSKSLDDVTTANGLITCKWEEAWPTINQFDISDQAETIQGLLSDGETLWIGTERGIRRLIGDSPSNFQLPEVQFNETGLFNQEVWKVCFFEGQPVGVIWLTKDLRVIASDFNTYQNIGKPIQDLLNRISPGVNVHASFVSRGPSNYYMLYIPTLNNTHPDTVCVYNLMTRTWTIWKPTDEVSTSLFLLDGEGQPRWLWASAFPGLETAFYLMEWSPNILQDRANIAGVSPIGYPVTIQTTWLDMGDYNIRKFVNQIIPTTADQTSLTIQVDGASNELDFISPLSVVPATAVIPASIPTDVFVPLASGPSHSRAFQFTFVSPPSTVKNVLTGFSIEAGQFHRY